MPFCYHSSPGNFLEEILHGYFVKSVVDMSPADGKLTFACYNEQRVKALEKRLLQRLQKEMINSPLFSSACAAAGNESNGATPGPQPKSKPKAKKTRQQPRTKLRLSRNLGQWQKSRPKSDRKRVAKKKLKRKKLKVTTGCCGRLAFELPALGCFGSSSDFAEASAWALGQLVAVEAC